MSRSPSLGVIVSDTPDATRTLGIRLAHLLRPGDVVLLHGDLGAGKTTLTQGIAQGLGITEPVQSPTFTIVAEHDGHALDGTPLRLYHLDLYRLGGEDDLEGIGFDDLLAPADGVTIIEWPERAGTWLPDRYAAIAIEMMPGSHRRLTVSVTPTDSEAGARFASLGLAPDEPSPAG